MSLVILKAKDTMSKEDYKRLHDRIQEKIGTDHKVSIVVKHHDDGDYTIECDVVVDRFDDENEDHQEQVTYIASDEFFDELVPVMETYEAIHGELGELFITLEII